MIPASLILLLSLNVLVAGYVPSFPGRPAAAFVHNHRTSALKVSFADDIVTNGLDDNDDEDRSRTAVASEKQITETSTFPECVVLSWECDVEAQIRDELSRRGPVSCQVSNQPYMVGVVGIPGSGKSTSGSILTNSLADLGSLLMPVDGYHYSIAELLQFEDPDDAIYRRGAADTFDVKSLQMALERIRFGDDAQVKVPGFDHARGDPEYDAHTFDRQQHRVVIVEGLYLLHDEAGWESIRDHFDLTIFVDADVDTCVDRLKIRNQCIPGYTKEEIEVRCDVVDRANAMAVDKSRQYADMIVQGVASKSRQQQLLQ